MNLVVAGAAGGAAAQGTTPQDPEAVRLERFWALDRFFLDEKPGVRVDQRYTWSVLEKAKADECFNGVGAPYGKPDADGLCTTAGGQPKVNDSYIWGLTLVGKKLFFGTLSNTLCGVERGYLEQTQPILTSEYVCEFGQGFKKTDSRTPNMFMYDTEARTLVSLNPDPTTAAAADALRRRTGGFRSAGNLNGVVFIAGTDSISYGLNMFAFDAETGALIGAKNIGGNICVGATPPGQPTCPGDTEYTNIRQWAAAGGNLYLGVGTTKPVPGTSELIQAGAVLKWVGDKTDPFRFIEVGHLPADAANMIGHTDGRLYITTWPSRTKYDKTVGADGKILGVPAGLYRSPLIPPGGLTEANVNDADWTMPLWLATSDGNPAHADVPTYDPDRMGGLHTGGGALVSYRGRIYFGTMTVPMFGTQDAMRTYDRPEGDFLRTTLGVHRPIALFEVKVPMGRRPIISMIVGEKYLPVWDPVAGGYTIRYDEAHRTGFTPRWAPSGFGNFWNTYTWAMRVFRDQVFIGTMDWSQIARLAQESQGSGTETGNFSFGQLAGLLRGSSLVIPREGADLLRFSDFGLLRAESNDGLGNDRNYGVRNMVTDGDVLYIGTANPMNLDAKGGWELIGLQ